MCDDCGRPQIGRRSFLVGVAAIAAVPVRAVARPVQAPTVELAPGLLVHPRLDWAEGLRDPGQLPVEAPGDVRVLLVHHSASGNAYGEDEVADQIRAFHSLHTGPEKRWPDVAYNFFVDRFGGVWEGRAGSTAGPVIGDATGGNQGFSQLVCLIGDFQVERPTPEAVTSLTKVLAWMATSYGVDPSPGARTTFVSRGSNLHPEGTEVECATISGHRDMSMTVCPGDGAYRLVTDELPAAVTELAASATATTTTVTPTTSTTVAPPPQPSATEPVTTLEQSVAAPTDAEASGSSDLPLPALLAGGAAVVAAGALVVRRRAEVATRPAHLRKEP